MGSLELLNWRLFYHAGFPSMFGTLPTTNPPPSWFEIYQFACALRKVYLRMQACRARLAAFSLCICLDPHGAALHCTISRFSANVVYSPKRVAHDRWIHPAQKNNGGSAKREIALWFCLEPHQAHHCLMKPPLPFFLSRSHQGIRKEKTQKWPSGLFWGGSKLLSRGPPSSSTSPFFHEDPVACRY